MEFKSVSFTQSGDNMKIIEPGNNNALDRFINTLSEEEKELPILNLSEDKQYQYIRAMFMFQNEVIENIMDCSSKSLMMLSHKLYNKNVKEISVTANFTGTKEEVLTESFNFNFKQTLKSEKTESITEYADENSKPIHGKYALLVDQKENVLNVFKQVIQSFNDNDGYESALTTAGIMCVFECMSLVNIKEQTVSLEGLILKDKQINQSFLGIINREEIEFGITTRPSNKFLN